MKTESKNRGFGKPLLLAFVLCVAPVSAVFSGCGGSNSSVKLPTNQFAGDYRVDFLDDGEPATYRMSVSGQGKAKADITGENFLGSASGTVNEATGQFLLSGINQDPDPGGVTGPLSAKGQFVCGKSSSITASILLTNLDGDTQTITITRVP